MATSAPMPVSVRPTMSMMYMATGFVGVTGAVPSAMNNSRPAFPLPPPEADAQALPGGGSVGYKVSIPVHGAKDLLPVLVVVDFTIDRGEGEGTKRVFTLKRFAPGDAMRLSENWGDAPISEMLDAEASKKDHAVIGAMLEDAERRAIRMLMRAAGSALAASLSMEEAEESLREGFAVSIMEG